MSNLWIVIAISCGAHYGFAGVSYLAPGHFLVGDVTAVVIGCILFFCCNIRQIQLIPVNNS